jgi:uncharacterized membrane protein
VNSQGGRAFCDILIAAVMIAVSIPLVYKKIPRNRFYGIRTPKSFASEDNWYKINRHGGKVLLYWSLPLLCIGVTKLFIPWDDIRADFWRELLSFGPTFGCLGAAVVQSLIYWWKV